MVARRLAARAPDVGVRRDEPGPETIDDEATTVTETANAALDLTDAAERARAVMAARSDIPFRLLADHLPIGVFIVDRSGGLVYANAIVEDLTGQAFTVGARIDASVVHEADRERVVAMAQRVYERLGTRITDFRIVSGSGAVRAVRCRMAPVADETGTVVGVIGTVADHTDVERQLEHRATHDDLTDLPNRALLAAHLDAALGRAAHEGRAVGVVFVGLLRVGVVTDALGHAAGDRLLRQAARRLVATVGSDALVSRFAEDRFVVVVEDMSEPAAISDLAARVIQAMDEPFVVDDDEAFIGAAAGISLAEAGDGTVDQLVSDAGVALARAIETDVPIEVFDAEMRAEVESRRTLELNLRRGLERGEFGLAYQPIVELDDGRLVGFEALARWTDPPSGDMGPAQFIPVAEESGLIGALGRELLGQACAQLAQWQRQHEDVFVSVNLSARQLAEPDLPETVASALAEAGAHPSGLHLEITETVLLDDVDRAVESLQRLKLTGVRLCLDDFGTGYSSLTYLCRLPVDVVKIDQTFVAGLGVSDRDSSVVAAIIGMAGSLGHDLVAEGVETTAQAGRLRALGCEMAQGYLFSRPVDAEAAGLLIA
jgi:diguanylate cyclase (GGDEF)-like protein/PAS domain S-box-containing protein